MLADDLLKFHTIPDLRELVISLENDSKSKQTELQHMVGSKYHDFIQSADLISSMQKQAEEMEQKLRQFWKYSEELTTKTNDLLDRTSRSQEKNSQAKTNSRNNIRIHSSSVWACLEECDVYGASRTVLLSKLAVKKVCIVSEIPPCSAFISSTLCDRFSDSFHSNLSEVRQTSFLEQTVLDDAFLLLIEDTCPPVEKALVLASCSLLAGQSRGDVLSQLLQAVDVQIEAATSNIDRPTAFNLSSAATQLVTAAAVLQKAILHAHNFFFKQLDPEAVKTLSSVMGTPGVAAFVSQGGLFSFYQLCCIKDCCQSMNAVCKASSFASSPSLKTSNSSGNVVAAGPIEFDFAGFVSDERRRCPVSECKRIFDKWLGEAIRKINGRSSVVLTAMGSAPEVARLQQRIWTAVTQVPVSPSNGLFGASTHGFGSPLTEHEGPALFADLVLRSGVGLVSDQEKSIINAPYSSQLHYLQADWESACLEMLAPKRRRADKSDGGEGLVAGSVGGMNPSTLLWSLAFRTPFMLQVERLLRESCEEVLRRVRDRLLEVLAAEGVAVDARTLAVTSVRQSQPAVGGDSNLMVGLVSDYADTTDGSVQSPRIYARAESVRSLLESEITDLLAEIVLPVQEGDPQSGAALSRALYVQCAQLVGQVIVLLRVLAVGLGVELKKPIHKSTSSVSSSPLLAALLVVGRLTWLLRVRGRFLEEALTPAVSFGQSASTGLAAGKKASAAVTSVSADHQQLQQFDLSTEDQLRSAFEIADTNGDGLMTFEEATEAVQALAIVDTGNLADHPPGALADAEGRLFLCPALSPGLTPSITFTEFALLCAHLLTPEACNPLQRLQLSTDMLTTFIHRCWVVRLIADLVGNVEDRLAVELGITAADQSEAVSTEAVGSVCSFRHSWCSATVEMNDGDDLESIVKEILRVPTQVTATILELLFQINSKVSSSTISVDTVERLPVWSDILNSDNASRPTGDIDSPGTAGDSYLLGLMTRGVSGSKPDELNPGDEQMVARLGSFVGSSIQTLAVKEIVALFRSLRARILLSPLDAAVLEDISVQAIFDLIVCKNVCPRNTGTSPDALVQSVNDEISGWQSHLDPINAELLLPLLYASAETYASKIELLIPRVAPGRSSSPVDSAARNSTTPLVSPGDIPKEMVGVFPSKFSHRFGLLPLSISSQAMSGGSAHTATPSKTVSKPSKRDVLPTAESPRESAGAGQLKKEVKSTSASLDPVRRGLMSSLGNLLGGSSAAADK